MGMKSRRKGAKGELEIAALIHSFTGWTIKRRVRQHESDSDLEGVPHWAVEVKRYSTATRADIATWWEQAKRQGLIERKTPVLFYRKDRDEWRAVWPAAQLIGGSKWADYPLTVESSVEVWAAAAREVANSLKEVA